MKRLALLLCLVSLCAYGQRKPISTGGGGNQVTVTDDTSTNATMYPVWIPTGAGTRQMYITTSKITWNPSTGVFTVAGSIGTGTAPTACGTATGCFGATGASTASTKTASQGSLRLDSTSGYWLFRNVNGTSEATVNTAFASTCGATCTLDATNGISQIVQCTQSCTVTLFAPVLHAQILVYMEPGVTGTITLAALGGSGQYGKCDGSAYGTAGTGTFALSSATGNRVGLVAMNTTKYDCVASQGTATVN